MSVKRNNGGEVAASPTVVMIADGWHRDVFLDLLDRNLLPEIKTWLIDNGGLIKDVVSNLPSVSIASHTSILTSAFQDEHGIPAHRWQDVDTGKPKSYLSLLGPIMANRDISPKVKTVFEASHYPHSISVQGIICRGASERVWIPTMRPSSILRLAAKQIIRTPESMTVVWLPRVDALSHRHGPHSREVVREMIETSRCIGAFCGALDSAGLFRDAKIIIVPDHGQREAGCAVRLEEVFRTWANLDVAVNPQRRKMGKDGVVYTSGDASAQVYFSQRHLDRLVDISRQVCDSRVVELFCWIDHRAQRWFFRGADGLGSATFLRNGKTHYSVIEGDDPLGICMTEADLDLSRPMIDVGPYPDVLHQVMRSFVPNRSGNSVLFAGKGHHFGRAPRPAFKLGYHRGTHGGVFSDEVVVAAVQKGMGEISEPIRAADLLRICGLV